MLKEDKRRIQLTGGATYTVSLPIKWARDAGIKQGDELSLIQRRDKSLILTPVKKKDEQIRCAELVLRVSERFEDNFRHLIAHYLVGYDLIKLLSPDGFDADTRKRIKMEVRKRLVGMEIVAESANEMVLKSFLKYEDFTLWDAIDNMSKIILTMHEDAISAVVNSDNNRAKDVIERDNEVDRFYLLIVRQLKAVITDPELAKKMGESRPRDGMGYRIIVKNMERIGDHIESIAKNSMRMISPVPVCLDSMKDAGTRTRTLFTETLSSLFNKDIVQANEVITNANILIDMVESVNERILTGEGSVTDKISAFSIMESLGKISKYCEDIAEITINLGVDDPLESEF